jgi:hypothetical protein
MISRSLMNHAPTRTRRPTRASCRYAARISRSIEPSMACSSMLTISLASVSGTRAEANM